MFSSFTVYRAEAPLVDANVIHSYADLAKQGYALFDKREVVMHMECVYERGTLMSVRKKTLDLSKIQSEYNLCREPRIVDEDFDTIVLTDDITVIEIEKKYAQRHYMADKVTDMFVVDLMAIWHGDKTSCACEQIEQCFRETRGFAARLGGFYRIDYRQAKVIDFFCKELHLLDWFDEERDHIYIGFSR